MNPEDSSDVRAVVRAASRRADFLAAGDAGELRALHHPGLRWTTHRGEILDFDHYIAGNTRGDLTWHRQHLEDVFVTVERDAAVLTAVVLDDVERDGVRQVFRMRLTQTWVRHSDEWLCLAGHAGPLMPD